ncbi:phage tail tape measure protein [Streptomyces sp. NPDC090306]|uniref:phage tail tape measure protein n=1 Tax=Streptomyces sp. NPDC090306 TaxID=3365961 RepID=UPI0038036DE5
MATTTAIVYSLIGRDNASKTLNKVGKSASTTEKVLGRLGKAAKLAGAAVAGGLAVGLAKGVKDAMAFQTEMTRISTQAGATAKDVKVLSKQVLQLGTTTQQGPQQLADSLYHLKSVGMDNVSAMKALKEASDLAAVGGADLEETTNALAGAWRTGIKGAGSFHQAVSTVNAIIGAGNMSMEQFNAAIGTGILPSAKTFGLSLGQVGAALALMTDEGIDSASAATRLRMSFSLLGAPSKAAEKQLGKIGLTGLQLADAMRGKNGLIGAIQLLKDHLDASGMSASEQSQILSRAFGGGRSSSGILLMINNLDVLKKKQDQINNSTSKFDAAVKTQRKTAEAQWKLLMSNLDVISVQVGSAALPPVTKFVQFLSQKALPAAKSVGAAVVDIIPVDKIESKIKSVSGMVSDFVSGLKGTEKTSLPTPMLKAPTAPAAIAAPKIDPSAAKGLGAQIRGVISTGIEGADWSKVGAVLGSSLATAFQWIAKNGGKLMKQLAGALGKLDWFDLGKDVGSQSLGFALGFVANFGSDLFHKDFWTKHWLDTIIAVLSFVGFGKLAGPLAKILEHLPLLRMFAPLLRGVEHMSAPLGDAIGNLTKFFGKSLWKGIARVFPEGAAVLERESGLFTTRLGVWGLELLEYGKRAVVGLGNGIRAGSEWVIAKIGELLGYLLKPFAGAGKWLLSKGAVIVNGLKDGLVSQGRYAAAWAKLYIIDPLVSRFSAAGTWLKARGAAAVTGLKDGVVSQARYVAAWTKLYIIDPLVTRFSAAGSWLKSRGSAVVTGFKSGVTTGAKAVGAWTKTTVIDPVTTRFAKASVWLVTKGSAVVSGLRAGVTAGARGIGAWTTSHVISPVTTRFAKASTWLVSKGSALISGLKAGVVNGIKGISSWLKKWVVDPIVNAVRKHFKINSPSKVFAEIGGHMISGLMKGLSATSGTAIAKKVFGSLPSALKALVNKGLVSVSELGGKALSALGLGDSSASGSAQQFAQLALKSYGWGPAEWPALKALWNGESGWRWNAENASSGAYGIPQALPASKMASAGSDWKTNADTQIKWGLSYIKSRYGSPSKAYSDWTARSPHWYASGTQGAKKGWAWVGEKGPELINLRGGETILDHHDSVASAAASGIRLPGYAGGTLANAEAKVKSAQSKVNAARDKLASAERRRYGIATAKANLAAAKTSLKAAKTSLANVKRSAKTTVKNTIAAGLLSTLETGTASTIKSKLSSLVTQLQNAGMTSMVKLAQKDSTKLQSLATKKATVTSTIATAKTYAATKASDLKDYLSSTDTSATSVSGLLSEMKASQAKASSFAATIKSLRARGLNTDMLGQLADAGPDSQLATLLSSKSLTTSQIAQFNKLAASQSKLATSYGNTLADAMYDSGAKAADGFLAGLKAQQASLQKQMNTLATSLVKTVKKKLGIKSPSRVFRDQVGKMVALGTATGVSKHTPHVVKAVRGMTDAAAGVSSRPVAIPVQTSAASAGAAQAGAMQALADAIAGASGTEVHVHFDDQALKDLIDARVKPQVKASEKRTAHLAKVGPRG